MNVTIHGDAAAPAAVIVGSWNPLLAGHDALLAELRARAAAAGEIVVPVLLDPPPATLISDGHPLFEDARTRLDRLRASGVGAVVHVGFRREDLALGLLDLIATLREHLDVRRLFVGRGQTLGSGDRGNRVALIRAMSRYRLKVDRLPPDRLKDDARRVLAALGCGQVVEASRLAGRPPVVRAAALRDGERLAWADGRYEAVPVTAPVTAPGRAPEARPVPIDVVAGRVRRDAGAEDGDAQSAPYLAFVRGPGDEPAAAGTAPARVDLAADLAGVS